MSFFGDWYSLAAVRARTFPAVIEALCAMEVADCPAACLGAAMIAAAGEGADAEKYRELAALGNRTEKSYVPCEPERYERKYRQFCRLYQSMLETARLL